MTFFWPLLYICIGHCCLLGYLPQHHQGTKLQYFQHKLSTFQFSNSHIIADCPKRDIVVALSGVTKKAQNSRAGTYVYWKQYDGLNAWKSIQGSSAIWFSNDRNQWLIGNRRNIAPHRSFYKNHAGLRTIFYEPCPTGDDWEYWDNGKWFNAPHGTANIRYKGKYWVSLLSTLESYW